MAFLAFLQSLLQGHAIKVQTPIRQIANTKNLWVRNLKLLGCERWDIVEDWPANLRTYCLVFLFSNLAYRLNPSDPPKAAHHPLSKGEPLYFPD